MKNCKMVFTIGLVFAVMMLAAACTDSNKSDDSIFDYEKLDVDEYVYPSDFELGDDLRGAITELACCYHDFDETVIDGEDWKNIFLARFIQNSRYSFQYMDEQETKNNGFISQEQVEYIQYSLTGKKLDFSDYMDEKIDVQDTTSGMNFGNITDYEYEIHNGEIVLSADMQLQSDGTNNKKKEKLTVYLIKNPYSCFDGYSIRKLISEDVTENIKADGKEHVFYAADAGVEEDNVFALEFLYAEDNLQYGHFVYVDLSENKKLAEYIRNNSGSDFKVTYILNDTQDDVIERVTPTEIAVHTETTDNTEKHIQDFEKLSEMIGTYHYTSDYGTGRLMIEATENGIDLSDYESEDTYRFLANETNVKNEEENKVYLEYPAQVYEDDTVIFEYYILEKASDGIDVYYSPSSFDEAEFLYHAVREN